MMIPARPTELAHDWVRAVLRDGDLAIDATAGNGHDTLMLAKAVGPGGRVIAFDIQSAAIDATRARVEAAGLSSQVELHRVCHSSMGDFVSPGSAAAVMFNLGYLPGNEHDVITQTHSTLAAIEAALACLKPDGLLTVICYLGHSGGDEEAREVESFLASMVPHGWRIARYTAIGSRGQAPVLLAARRSA
ncbi:MAG: class I SAM-dependent methyltransferase [Luteolibacter sp.]